MTKRLDELQAKSPRTVLEQHELRCLLDEKAVEDRAAWKRANAIPETEPEDEPEGVDSFNPPASNPVIAEAADTLPLTKAQKKAKKRAASE